MKYASLKNEFKNNNILFLTISFFLSFIFYKGRLGGDDIQAFNFAYNLIEISNFNLLEHLSGDSNIWQFSHRKIWITQNVIIISITKLINFFFDFNLKIISQYFCGWILSFYTFCTFFIILKIFLKNEIDFNTSLLVTVSIFFGTSLISFFTGAYIESLVIFLISLRFILQNSKLKFLVDIFLVLIKPYYLIIVACLIYHDNKISKKTISYLFLISVLVMIDKLLTITAFKNFMSSLPMNFELDFIFKNLFDMFFSFGFGIFFTSSLLTLYIIGGFNFESFVKLSIFFPFLILLSSLTFWHGQSPGNRYLISCLFIFIPELINFIKRIIYEKNYKITFFIILIVTFLNLPSIEFRNTNIKNYSDTSAKKGYAISPSDRDLKAFPTSNFEFNNIVFAQNIFWNKILKQNNNTLKIDKYSFIINDVYPMTGLNRIIYIIENNLDYIDNKNFLHKIPNILITLKGIYYIVFTFLILIILISFHKLPKINEKN